MAAVFPLVLPLALPLVMLLPSAAVTFMVCCLASLTFLAAGAFLALAVLDRLLFLETPASDEPRTASDAFTVCWIVVARLSLAPLGGILVNVYCKFYTNSVLLSCTGGMLRKCVLVSTNHDVFAVYYCIKYVKCILKIE